MAHPRRVITALIIVALAAGGWELGARLAECRSGIRESVPRLQIDQNVLELSANPAARAVFQITNAGNKRLILYTQGRTCSCVAADLPDLVIPSKATQQIEIPVKEGQLVGGRAEFVYHTNDPERPVLQLVVVSRPRAETNHPASLVAKQAPPVMISHGGAQ